MESLEWTYALDELGRLRESTDPAGRRTTVTYEDRRGELTRRSNRPGYGDTVERFDDRGRRYEVQGPGRATASYMYDGRGYLVASRRKDLPSLEFCRDSIGRVLQIGVEGIGGVEYQYDFLGRIERIEATVGAASHGITVQHDSARRSQSWSWAAGLVSRRRWGPRETLEAIEHFDGSSGRVYSSFGYEYDLAGRVHREVHRGPWGEHARRFRYEPGGALATASEDEAWRVSYGYDDAGSRVQAASTTASFDGLGRLLAVDGRPCASDAMGAIVDLQGSRYEYDARGALTAVSQGDREVRYAYDADGRLVRRTSAGRDMTFIVDPTSPIWRPLAACVDGQWHLYLWDGDVPVARLGGDGADELYLADLRGTPRVVLGSDGSVRRTLDFDPYGVPLASSDTESFAPGFAGLFFDAEAGISITARRAYAPRLGQFLQRDPLVRMATTPQDLPPYTFAGGDPVNFVDRTGGRPTRYGADFLAQMNQMFQSLGRHAANVAAQNQALVESQAATNQQMSAAAPQNQADSVVNQAFENLAQSLQDAQAQQAAESAAAIQQQAQQLFWSPVNRHLLGPVLKSTISDPALRSATNAAIEQLRVGGDPGEIVHEATMAWVDDMTGQVLAAGLGDEAAAAGYQAALNTSATGADLATIIEAASSAIVQHCVGQTPLAGPISMLKTAANVAEGYVAMIGHALNGQTQPVGLQPTSTGMAGGHSHQNDAGQYAQWTTIDVSQGPYTHFHQRTAGRANINHVEAYPAGGDYQFRVDGTASFVAHTHRVQSQGNFVQSFYRNVFPFGDLSGGAVSETVTTHQRQTLHVQQGGELILSGEDLAALEAAQPVSLPPGMAEIVNHSVQPTNVGGVWLAGAGRALEGLGPLRGVHYDRKTRRLVLLGAGQEAEIGLPPLDLADIATVFRTVYEDGAAPFVSIDPDPADPKGPMMLTRHSPRTRDTYVGWVLFEADRVMKAYSLGQDNLTRLTLSSKVPGYTQVSEAWLDDDRSDETWTRFWLVPEHGLYRTSPTDDLTLVEVPIVVRTQRMTLKDGQLVPASDDRASPADEGFAAWLSNPATYAQVAQEAQSIPPGRDAPVAFFTELRRLATVTAVAERLVSLGIPMPSWMAHVSPAACETPAQTPAITVERRKAIEKKGWFGPPKKMTRIQSVYGGADLGVEQKTLEREGPLADVQDIVGRAALMSKLGEVFKVAAEGESLTGVALPIDETPDVGQARRTEIDLALGALVLARTSGRLPTPDLWDRQWTLDLPRLKPLSIVVGRTGSRRTVATAHMVQTPLGTMTAVFRDRGVVPELGGAELMVPTEPGPLLAIANAQQPDLAVHDVLHRDGRRWSFDAHGRLVLDQMGARTVHFQYVDETSTRLRQMSLRDGAVTAGQIAFEYDESGRCRWAIGSDGGRVEYRYDAEGNLTQAVRAGRPTTYGYRDGRLDSIAAPNEGQLSLRYDDDGRLSEVVNGHAHIEYTYEDNKDGHAVHARMGKHELVRTYDPSWKPRSIEVGDVLSARWTDEGAAETMHLKTGHRQLSVRRTQDGKTAYREAEEPEIIHQRDHAGRLESVTRGGQQVLSLGWQHDGLVESVRSEGTLVRPRYDEHQQVEGLFVAKPSDGESFDRWLDVGRAQENGLKLRDCSGLSVGLKTDDRGRLTGISADGENGPDEQVSVTWDAHNQPSLQWADGMRVEPTSNGEGRPSLRATMSGEDVVMQHRPDGWMMRDRDGNETSWGFRDDGQVQHAQFPARARVTRVPLATASQSESTEASTTAVKAPQQDGWTVDGYHRCSIERSADGLIRVRITSD